MSLGKPPKNGYGTFSPGPRHQFHQFNGFPYPLQGIPIYQQPQYVNASGPGAYSDFTGPPTF